MVLKDPIINHGKMKKIVRRRRRRKKYTKDGNQAGRHRIEWEPKLIFLHLERTERREREKESEQEKERAL